MIFTIKSKSEHDIVITCNNKYFQDYFGKELETTTDGLFIDMNAIAQYVNDVLKQECLFDVE